VNDERILAAVESKRDIALTTHRFVHQHPGLAHQERECSRYLADLLEGAGFEVERGIAGMPTAFRATLTGAAPGRSGEQFEQDGEECALSNARVLALASVRLLRPLASR
jgi:hypothetical protein